MTPSMSGSKRRPQPTSNAATQYTKKSRKTHRQSEAAPRYISQDSPEEPPPLQAGTKGTLSALQDNVDQQKHWRSVEKNLRLALNGQLYASADFARALSSKVQFQEEAVYSVSEKKKGKNKKEKTDNKLSALGPIPRQIDVMVILLYKVNSGVTGVLGLLNRKEISNQLKDYDMKNKWDNFESLLWNVHGETVGGYTNSHLYGPNVVNYVTMKKYMIMYWEILLWYIENVKYPLAPENMDQGLCFYTKGEDGHPHESQKYVTAMKECFDDIIAKSSLRISMSQSYNQDTLDKYLKLMRLESLQFLPIHRLQLVHWNESEDYVCNKLLMSITKQRTAFGQAL
eukprot:jgi/Psemu1/43153/gm1.43153_g